MFKPLIGTVFAVYVGIFLEYVIIVLREPAWLITLLFIGIIIAINVGIVVLRKVKKK